MFSGGTETSSNLLEWTMSELMRNPEAMEKVQAEVRRVFGGHGKVDERRLDELIYLKSVIKETLRFHPPIPMLVRECREKCEINGYDIPTKSRVILNVWAIGKDQNYWVEPNKFVPERFLDNSIDHKGTNFEFIPFGAGRRVCPGILFGMVSVEYTLSQLLYHFDWKLPDQMNPENLDMTEVVTAGLQRKNNLRLIPTPYVPL